MDSNDAHKKLTSGILNLPKLFFHIGGFPILAKPQKVFVVESPMFGLTPLFLVGSIHIPHVFGPREEKP